jgi:hypothetical protein
LAAVYHLLGRKGHPSWYDLYGACEVLEAIGGKQRLSKRTGVAPQRIKLLKDNSNDPELTGEAARHAVRQKGFGPSEPITLGEGRAIMDELIQGYVRWRSEGP